MNQLTDCALLGRLRLVPSNLSHHPVILVAGRKIVGCNPKVDSEDAGAPAGAATEAAAEPSDGVESVALVFLGFAASAIILK